MCVSECMYVSDVWLSVGEWACVIVCEYMHVCGVWYSVGVHGWVRVGEWMWAIMYARVWWLVSGMVWVSECSVHVRRWLGVGEWGCVSEYEYVYESVIVRAATRLGRRMLLVLPAVTHLDWANEFWITQWLALYYTCIIQSGVPPVQTGHCGQNNNNTLFLTRKVGVSNP